MNWTPCVLPFHNKRPKKAKQTLKGQINYVVTVTQIALFWMLFRVISKAEMNSQCILYTKNKWMHYFLKFMHKPNCYAGTIKKI